jgi:DNA ligase-1
MSDPCDRVIGSLEVHNSRLDKEGIILAQAERNNNEFFEGCRLALDPMITFGVKQVPERSGTDGAGYAWAAFNANVQKLISRQITGNAARDLIQDMMDHSTNSQWNGWYRRILIKDLRCGVSEKTVNKVVEKKWPDYAVPIFSCQLAHDSANHENKVAGKKLIEVKLDGVRVITVVRKDGRVEQFSRNGKELVNFENIKAQISAVVKKNPPKYDLVLDGEVMSSSFQDLMKQVHRKSDVAADDAVLHLFDMCPLDKFLEGRWDKDQSTRSAYVRNWILQHEENLPNVTALENEEVDLDSPEGKKRFIEINQYAIKGGYEGIMIKDPKAPYECKRTTSWLKLKPFIEVSLTVTALEEGTGRNVGKLGAFVCEGVDDGKTIRVNVGSGFSDSDRDTFWANHVELDSIVGQIVEVRADAITQNQDGSYSLRFPRFLRFRGFEHGEKI